MGSNDPRTISEINQGDTSQADPSKVPQSATLNNSTCTSNLQPTSTSDETSSATLNQEGSPPILSLKKQILMTIIITSTTILTSSSGQVLNIALPTIKDDLEISEGNLQWVVSSYNLSVGCLLLFSGRIADIYGRKKVLVLGMIVFTIFTLAGGFMQNGPGLIVSRALAGCGVAMTTPSTTGIIAESFIGKARSRVFTCFGAGFSVGGILGLLIGGLFVSYVKYTWRSCLFVVAGISLLIGLGVILIIPADEAHTSNKHLDLVGATVITTGLVLFLFAISGAQSAPHGWKTGYIIALLVLGILLTILFFLWEHYVTIKTANPPLMRLALWTRAKGRLAALYLTSALAIMGFIVALYNATLYFQEVQSVGPVGTMLRFLPTEVAGIICSVLVALLIHRVPAYWLVVTGLLACGFGNMCFAISKQDTNYWELPFHGTWLIVFGVDIFLPTGLIFVSHFSLPDEYSVASGLFQTILRLGSSIGLALTSIIFDSQYKRSLSAGTGERESYLKGIQSSFWLSAAGCWFGVIIAVIALRGLGIFGEEGELEVQKRDLEKQQVDDKRDVSRDQ
uniref:Major facilitator superfamily (MFS) profile domain-containing protein n=1 Tax=Kwoniella bestiolae CBS 10118 TaxID=1296100 RepID=A0A1B9FSI3_9TREE|nr:hypothetical protein I302_08502 [Kwoniella bestiolae CBS 10118]OCF21725.1 hypothetical protein I302_08502 [Kwoniella bestiolae CBS 10118]